MRFRLGNITVSLLAGLLGAGLSSAAISAIDGDFSTVTPDWAGTGTWARYQVATNQMFALEADNLAPFYNYGNAAPQASVSIPVVDLIPGGIYEISFDFASVEGYYLTGDPEPIITLGLGGLQLMVGGTPTGGLLQGTGVRLVDPALPIGTYGGLVGTLICGTFTFTAPAASTTLGLRAAENPGISDPLPGATNALVLVDNIALTLIAVPEPGTTSCVVLATAALLLKRRRPTLTV